MPEIKIRCPKCGQHILCDESHRGTQIGCPSCKQKLSIPVAKQSASTPPTASREGFLHQCPQCSSSDIQRAAMGYMAGASQVSGIGVGATPQGGIGVGTFGGSQQTLLSAYLRPPSKRSTVWIVLITWCVASVAFALYSCIQHQGSPAGLVAAPIIIPFLYSCFDANDKEVFYLIAVAPTVIALTVACFNFHWNNTEYPKRMEKYAKTWYCKTCGFAWLV